MRNVLRRAQYEGSTPPTGVKLLRATACLASLLIIAVVWANGQNLGWITSWQFNPAAFWILPLDIFLVYAVGMLQR
jgi:hypothetical protein